MNILNKYQISISSFIVVINFSFFIAIIATIIYSCIITALNSTHNINIDQYK